MAGRVFANRAPNTRKGYNAAMTMTLTYRVPGMHCAHCETAVKEELSPIPGVEAVQVDLVAKNVVVHGHELADRVLRAALDEAGYEAV